MTNTLWYDPVINIKGLERLQLAPDWICVGMVVVSLSDMPYVAEIIAFSENGNPILEFDVDGSDREYTCAEVVKYYQPWREGMSTYDSTGKDRFSKPQYYPADWKEKQIALLAQFSKE
jgi:hypothetical protein